MEKENDYRLSHILHEGDQICTSNAIYTISGEPLGFGGTSVLYPATRSDSKLEFAVKECFPGGNNRFHRLAGVIQPVDSEDIEARGQLERYRRQLQEEKDLGQTIRNTSTRAIGIWETLAPTSVIVKGEFFSDVSDGIFSVLERMDQKGMTFSQLLQYIKEPPSDDAPLKTGSLPKIHTTALIMEQVLLALQRIHEAGEHGFVFGDIQSGNIFFSDCRLAKGDIGIGNLLDFGCARPLVDGKQTAQITDCQVFSTVGFIPPELLDPEKNNGTLCLTPAADIYSVGCLMLRCLLRPGSIRRLSASPIVGDNAIDGEAATHLGCTGHIRTQLNRILEKALHPEPEARYQDADEMLEDILILKRDTRPPEYLLPQNLSTPECFDLVLESRRADIQRISKVITRENPVFIWGFPGLGKTELSIAFARQCAPDRTYLIRYTESMRNTIINLRFSDIQDPDLHNLSKEERAIVEEKIYRKKLDILRKYPRDSILIIDNFDSKTKTFQQMIQEPAYMDLLGTSMHLIITTRSQPDDVTPEIQPLKETYLIKLMRRFIGNRAVEDDILLQLLDACGYHTLTAELIGKAIGNKPRPVSPSYILQKLQNNQMKRAVLPKSRTGKDRVFDEDTIYGHLETMFDIACLSELEQDIMRHSALLPIGGVDVSIFLRAECSEKNRQAVEQLVSKGWLHVSQERMISVHPLVCDLINEELGITYEKCKLFLYWLFDGAANDQMYRLSTANYRDSYEPAYNPLDYRLLLVEHFGYKEYTNPKDEIEDCWRLSHMIAEVFANASEQIADRSIPYAASAAYCFNMARDPEMCLQYSHQTLDGLIKKIRENPDKDWHDCKMFTIDEERAILDIRSIWCPQLEERLWDIEYAELYGNELFMDHSKKPIQVQNIYEKLRYLLLQET